MGYALYALPALGAVKHVGVFTPGPDGFDQLERSLDLFRSEGVALVIQLGEALLGRGTARTTDIDHIRRLLGRRRQAMLVCTDDLGRAADLQRLGVQGEDSLAVRPNIVHLDGGFRTRLSNNDVFTVVCPSPSTPAHASLGPASSGRGGLTGRVGLAFCAIELDVAPAVREHTPKLLISAGNGPFLDETYNQQDPESGWISTRVIVFGDVFVDRGGQRVDHAIVDLNEGTVRLLPQREAGGEA